MDYLFLESALQTSPAVRLLRSQSAAMIVSFLSETFKRDHVLTVPRATLLECLRDHLDGLRAAEREEIDHELDDIRLQERRLRETVEELGGELESLRKRRSQIPERNLQLRARILTDLNIPERDIPFAGELLRVRVVVANAGRWGDLLTVCQYFLDHPRPNLYARELPLAVHTKFVEEHQSVLREMLDELLPPQAIDPAANRFEERFLLRYTGPPSFSRHSGAAAGGVPGVRPQRSGECGVRTRKRSR